ncbi:MAG: lipopolysaccharide biosynthesis, partial [Ruminococcus sp.]|nr:lipopolysaccharide biosynthesis [Ruminococcus sp.]
MNDSYSIKDIINLLLGKLWMLILFLILGAGGAFSYAHFIMPVMYESYTSMYVRSNSNILGSFDISMGDLSTSRSLLNTYVVVL